jgi:hypothetical protein
MASRSFRLWIKKNYPCAESALRKEKEAAHQMAASFSGLLRPVHGIIYIEAGRDFEPLSYIHWWCIDKSNNIIDPTAHQFSQKILRYEAYKPPVRRRLI